MEKIKNIYKNFDFNNKKILVMGLGLNGGGVGITRFLAKKNAQITVTDLKTEKELQSSIEKLRNFDNITYILGEHRINDFISHDMVIKGAGIKWDNPYISAALKAGKIVETDIGLFFELCSGEKIGITGSKGKSTTTALIHHIIQQEIPEIKLGGNIAVSPFEDFDETDSNQPYVLELSSWQLADLSRHHLSPDIAVITTIIPDHMNYYGTMEKYFDDKKLIYTNQNSNDFCLLNIDNVYIFRDILCSPIPSNIITITKDAEQNRKLFEELNRINKPEQSEKIAGSILISPSRLEIMIKKDTSFYDILCSHEKITYTVMGQNCSFLFPIPENKILVGEHNLYSIGFAFAAAFLEKITVHSIKKGLENYRGLDYRNQIIKRINGITFVNDTTATIPEAVAASLSVYPDKKVILIAGGVDKRLPIDPMCNSILQKCKKVFLLEGNGSELLKEKLTERNFDQIASYYNSLDKAISDAYEQSTSGDIIILSPGFASFNLFKNEFERGDLFNSFVHSINK